MTPDEKNAALKKIVKPSVRTEVPTATTPAVEPTPEVKDYVWYLKSKCGGQDKYEFATHDEAYKFGWALREKHGDKIRVEIAVETVRVFAI
jgi:hypothetical protein